MTFRRRVAGVRFPILVVVSVPAVVALGVAWLLPVPRPLKSGAAIVMWLALLFPWLNYVKG